MFTIAIPSHHRSSTIGTHTLRMLDAHSIPHPVIKIFVAPEEVAVYRSIIPEDIEIIEGRLGCIETRAAIRDHFPTDQNIVYMDDDLKALYSVCDLTPDHATCQCYNKKNVGTPTYKKQIPLPDLSQFLTEAFQTMRKEGAHLGGIYPICNGYFATHRYTTTLNYICGFMYLEINQKDIQLRGDQYAEDFERSCAFFARDGKIVRFEYVMAKSNFCSGVAGRVGRLGRLSVETRGCAVHIAVAAAAGASRRILRQRQASRTVERTRIAQEKLAAMYPDYLVVKPPTKGNKYWNLKIKKQPAPSATLGTQNTASVALGPPQSTPHDDQQ